MRILKTCLWSIIFFTFFFFSSDYLVDAGVKGHGLPDELRQLGIKDAFIKSSYPDVGMLGEIKGKGRLVVVHRAAQYAYYGRKKNPVYEEDSLYTLSNCRTRVEFKDRNTIIMAPETHLDIEEVYASLLKGEKRSVFRTTRGKAIFYALRLFSYPKMKLQVKTPNANIGIRGTRFGTEVVTSSKGRSMLFNRMLASRRLQFLKLAEAEKDIITRVYAFDGEVDVTSLVTGKTQRLRKFEIIEVDNRGLGEVKVDPEKSKAFLESVTSGMVSTSIPDKSMMERDWKRESLDRIQKRDDAIQRERIDRDHNHFEPQIPSSGH